MAGVKGMPVISYKKLNDKLQESLAMSRVQSLRIIS